MSEELEHRLRRDFSTLDDVSIGDAGVVVSASRMAIERAARRRRRTVVGMSAALVAAAGIGLWTTSTEDDELATTDTATHGPSRVGR